MYAVIHASRGFTLIELMIVVAMVAVLATLGMPGFNSFIADQRVRIASANLHNDLKLARATAIANQRHVALRFTSADAWRNGWSVCYWDNTTSTCTELLQTMPPVAGDNILICHSLGAAVEGFVFRPDGRIQGAAVPDDARITVSDTLGDTDNGNDAIRSIFFGPAGRMQTIIQNGWQNGGQPC